MIMGAELLDAVSQMPLTKDTHLAQTLMFYAADEPFNEGSQISIRIPQPKIIKS
ncbi:MAG: hypothetical protein H8D47_03415 [Planctomycetes bacterium]|nr:hypothetical protein [Planctomycetota bacterium]